MQAPGKPPPRPGQGTQRSSSLCPALTPPQKEMAPHSSTLAWKILWMEEPGGLQSWGRTESDMTEATQQQQQQLTLPHTPILSHPLPPSAGKAF